MKLQIWWERPREELIVREVTYGRMLGNSGSVAVRGWGGMWTLFSGSILDLSGVDNRDAKEEEELHNFNEISEQLGDVEEVEA